MNEQIYVIGVGPGDIKFLTNTALGIIKQSDILVGGSRNLLMFKHLSKEEFVIKIILNKYVNILKLITKQS